MRDQPRQRKSAKDRKAEIVQTAIRLAADVGPDRLTTEMLARAIGISQPAIFRHFASKNMIWQEVANHITTKMQVGAPPTEANQPSSLQLRQHVLGHLAYIQKVPAIPAILFSRELHAENDELRAHFATMMDNRQAVFVELINRAKAEGDFAADLQAKDAAYLLLALIQGLAMRWSLSGRSFDLAVEGGRLMDMQMAGFRSVLPE